MVGEATQLLDKLEKYGLPPENNAGILEGGYPPKSSAGMAPGPEFDYDGVLVTKSYYDLYNEGEVLENCIKTIGDALGVDPASIAHADDQALDQGNDPAIDIQRDPAQTMLSFKPEGPSV